MAKFNQRNQNVEQQWNADTIIFHAAVDRDCKAVIDFEQMFVLGDVYDIAGSEIVRRLEAYQLCINRPDAAAKELLAAALIHVRLNSFDTASKLLERSAEADPANGYVWYALALSRFRNRRPSLLKHEEAFVIQKNLLDAATIGIGLGQAYLLLAFVKHDYYLRNGFRVAEPSIDQCLLLARLQKMDSKEWIPLSCNVPSIKGFRYPSGQPVWSCLINA